MTEKKFNDSVLTLSNQKFLSISGVETVYTMNNSQIELCACSQKILITGTDLEVEKLDVENGILKIKGFIDGIKYNQKKEKFLKRIFK